MNAHLQATHRATPDRNLVHALPEQQLKRPKRAVLKLPESSRLLQQALQEAWPSLANDLEALSALAALGRMHRIRQRSCLLRDGTINHQGSLWLLVQGKLSMGSHDAKGVWRQSRALHAGQWIDLATAWPKASFPETALALTPVLAQEFPAQATLALCRSRPALLGALLDSLSRNACEAMASRQALATQDFPARLAEWLLVELRLNGFDDCLTLQQLKRDLAAQLCVTPETLSRTLRTFQEQGLLRMQHREIRFLSLEGLSALASRRPTP